MGVAYLCRGPSACEWVWLTFVRGQILCRMACGPLYCGKQEALLSECKQTIVGLAFTHIVGVGLCGITSCST